MPTPARKPTDPVDHIMLIVGQLLEATKAASDGIKGLSVEAQTNAKAIIAASKTIEMLEEKVAELDKVVRDSTNAANLVGTAQTQALAVARIDGILVDVKKDLERLSEQVEAIGSHRANVNAQGQLLVRIGLGAAWLVTTGIAVWAVVAGR